MDFSCLKNKSVCVIGGSQSINGRGLGTIIDGHDIVIRTNVWSTLYNEEHTGIKTNIWAVSCALAVDDDFEKFVSDYLSKLNEAWELNGGSTFGWARVREMWFLPTIMAPTSLISEKTKGLIKSYDIKVKELHYGEYLNEILNNRRMCNHTGHKFMLSTGMHLVAFLIHNREHLKCINVGGFGRRKEVYRAEDIKHYVDDTVSEESMVFKINQGRRPEKLWGVVHDLEYEHEVMNNWIDQGLIRRLEDESSYSI